MRQLELDRPLSKPEHSVLSSVESFLGKDTPTDQKALSDPIWGLLPWGVSGSPWQQKSFSGLAFEGYIRNVVANRCIDLIAQAVGQVAPIIRSGEADLGDNHPVRRIIDHPNPAENRSAYFEHLLKDLLIGGEAYTTMAANFMGGEVSTRGVPKELWVLRPDEINIIERGGFFPIEFQHAPGGLAQGMTTYPVDQKTGMCQLRQIKRYHPTDKFRGLSPTTVGGRWIDQHNLGGDHNAAVLRNGGRIGGILALKEGVEKDLIDRAAARFMERYGNPEAAMRWLVLGGEWEATPLGTSNVELDFVEGSRQAARDICTAWNVPYVLVVPGESTYNNRESARLEFYEQTVLPLWSWLMDGQLGPWLSFYFRTPLSFEPDRDQISELAPRRKDVWESAVNAWEKGVLKRNETREALGYEPDTGPAGEEYSRPTVADQQTMAQQQLDAQREMAEADRVARASQPANQNRPGDNQNQPGDNRNVPPGNRDARSVNQKSLEWKARHGLPGTYAAFRLAPASAAAIVAWAKAAGIPEPYTADELHITTVYSDVPLPAYKPYSGADVSIILEPNWTLQKLGDATVLMLKDDESNPGYWMLRWRHEEAKRLGATWTHDSYLPHLSVGKASDDLDLNSIKPPEFGIELGQEFVRELDDIELTDLAEEEGKAAAAAVPFSIEAFRRLPIEVKAKGDSIIGAVDDEELIQRGLPIITETIRQFGAGLFSMMKLGLSFNLFDPMVERFIRRWGATRIKQLVGTTTRNALAQSMADGFLEGETTQQLMNRVREVFSIATRSRAKMIAETEVTIAAGYGSQRAMVQAGIEWKRWLATDDERTRDQHRDMDGQIRPVSDRFTAPSGATTLYPGGFGIAELDVMCRCQSVSFFPEEQGGLGVLADGLFTFSAENKARDDPRWRNVYTYRDGMRKDLDRQMEEAMRAGFMAQERTVLDAVATLKPTSE